VPPEVKALARLHCNLRDIETEAGIKPRKHLLQRLKLPLGTWDSVQASRRRSKPVLCSAAQRSAAQMPSTLLCCASQQLPAPQCLNG
jgi:hypothetical protein